MKTIERAGVKWNGVWFTAVCKTDDGWRIGYMERDELYFVARAENGAWWHVPSNSNKLEDLRGPYTFEQAIALARLKS